MTPSLFPEQDTAPRPATTYRPGAFAFLEPVRVIAALPLAQSWATMYGRRLAVPRLECWHGRGAYSYGGQVQEPKPWPQAIIEIKTAVEDMAGERFDACFANLYRDGNDCIAWHADDERTIGPVIASLSLGAPRRFVMRHKATKTKREWLLGHGDLLVMLAGVQAEWQHSVPRTKGRVGPRLNLTFRQTIDA